MVTMVLDLFEETYLENTGEIGPVGKPIMEPMYWTTTLYNFRIMNLLDISHFGHGKNYIKSLLSWVHGDIMWMDKLVQLDVALIAKITGLPTLSE
jgi:hypothetical protein